jgi:integrase
VLADDEIRAVWAACLDTDFGRIVKLLLFTACRREEIGGLRWSEFNLATGVITIPGVRTKNGRALVLTLPPAAADILRTTLRRAGREYVFGQRGGAFSRWSYDKMALDRRIAEAGQPLVQWGLHDLRRTVRTRMAKLGIKPHIAELILNHVGHKAGIGGVYDTHDYVAEIAEALAIWSRRLMEVVQPAEVESNITQLKRA